MRMVFTSSACMCRKGRRTRLMMGMTDLHQSLQGMRRKELQRQQLPMAPYTQMVDFIVSYSLLVSLLGDPDLHNVDQYAAWGCPWFST